MKTKTCLQSFGLIIALLATTSCGITKTFRSSSRKGLTITSLVHEGVTFKSRLKNGFYQYQNDHNITIVLLDGPIENPKQAAIIRMFWKPKAAQTPISKSATNMTIRYLNFSEGNATQLGIYAGGGFIYPTSKMARKKMTANIWDASVKLTDHTQGFKDPFSNATITGTIKATRDDALVNQLIKQLSMLASQRLGVSKIVMAK